MNELVSSTEIIDLVYDVVQEQVGRRKDFLDILSKALKVRGQYQDWVMANPNKDLLSKVEECLNLWNDRDHGMIATRSDFINMLIVNQRHNNCMSLIVKLQQGLLRPGIHLSTDASTTSPPPPNTSSQSTEALVITPPTTPVAPNATLTTTASNITSTVHIAPTTAPTTSVTPTVRSSSLGYKDIETDRKKHNGFRDDFVPKNNVVVEGNNVTFRIYCKGKGKPCHHDPVSWFISDESITFGQDPHFKQDNFQNCHMFEICKAEADEQGYIKVKSDWDERICFLEVISLKIIQQGKDPRLFEVGHDLKVPDCIDLIKESLTQQLQSLAPIELDYSQVEEIVKNVKDMINDQIKNIPSATAMLENNRKRSAEKNEWEPSNKRKGMASDGDYATCFFARYPDDSIVLISAGHFFQEVVDDHPNSPIEEVFSDHIIHFPQTQTEQSHSKCFIELLNEFHACGFISTTRKVVGVKSGRVHAIPDNFFDNDVDGMEEDIFIVLLQRRHLDEEINKLGVIPISIDNDDDEVPLPSHDAIVTSFGHLIQLKQKSDANLKDEDHNATNEDINTTPLVMSIGKEFNQMDATENVDQDVPSFYQRWDKVFYSNVNSKGLSGAPVLFAIHGFFGPKYHLKGVHLGEDPIQSSRMAQVIPTRRFNQIKKLAEAECQDDEDLATLFDSIFNIESPAGGYSHNRDRIPNFWE